jgi:hypothetical protein
MNSKQYVFLTSGALGSKNHPMCGVGTMIDMLMIILRWMAGLLPGGAMLVRREFLPIPVRADFGPCRGGFYPASSPGVGWMTMRLDPVPYAHVLSRPAPARMAGATCPRSMPRDGAQTVDGRK